MTSVKLSRAALKTLITEEIRKDSSVLLETPVMNAQDRTPPPPEEKDPDGYEGAMARRELFHLAQQAQQLHDMLQDEENLEPWVQAKLTKAADYVEAAFKAIIYDKQNPEGR